jgi:glycerophosphoryl diester phosphodiesterase
MFSTHMAGITILMKKSLRLFFMATVAIVGLWLFNSSSLRPAPGGTLKVLSHRGVHQTFDPQGLENDTCTALRIYPPRHAFIENTIPAMDAAFAAGADVVELDVHLTRDNVFAVFHDWTLDCRTNGTGVTEESTFATLRTLDLGFGYSADSGQTFPLRGKGVGLMPRLEDVFDAFPSGQFLINFKSRRIAEGEALANLLNQNPAYRSRVFGIYGGEIPTNAAMKALPGSKGYTRSSLKHCLGTYIAMGWSGYVPNSCKNQLVVVPVNIAWMFWGWPNLFQSRMQSAGSEVILVGPWGAEGFTTGLDTSAQLSQIPPTFKGFVWTNTVELTGPLLKEKKQ